MHKLQFGGWPFTTMNSY